MNWGKGLVIGLVLFMSFIAILVVLMFNSAEDSFEKDYYEKGLAYDVDYQQKQQVITDDAEPIIIINDDLVSITFKGAESGQINFKRPSNQKEDVYINFKGNKVDVDREKLLNGEWKMVIKWTHQQKKYLYQKSVFLP
jgi:hypothetical protein